MGLSEYHFQRLFTRWVGISPKRFLQFLTKENAKRLLEESDNVLAAAYEAGLSGPGRLHDLFVTCEAVTPGEFKNLRRRADDPLRFPPRPVWRMPAGGHRARHLPLRFIRGRRRPAGSPGRFTGALARARLVEDTRPNRSLTWSASSSCTGDEQVKPLHLHLRGTNFQIKVWEALLRIPPGAVVTYEDIAAHIGQPAAAAGSGQRRGRNPIPVLIPCHRVIRKMGEFGNYRWGSAARRPCWAGRWRRQRREP